MKTTQQTLIHIQELVKAKTDGAEGDLLRHVTDLLVHTDPARQSGDTKAFDAVLEQLLDKVSEPEKAELSKRIARLRNGPYGTTLGLSRETVDIAAPVLRHASCLTDADLIAVAKDMTQRHMLAISQRAKLSPAVTDALLDKGKKPVKHAVASNFGARFSPDGMSHLMELSLEDEDLWRKLRWREDVDAGVLDHLIRFYKHKIEDLIPLSIEFVDEVEQRPAAPTPAPKPAAPRAAPKAQEPAPPEKPRTKTTETMLIDAARRRAMPDVIRHLAALTHVDEPTVEKCLSQATLSALMILCKANKITASAFAALLQLRETESGGSIAATIPHLRRYEAMHPDTARRVIELSIQRKQETAKQAETATEQPA